MGEFAVPRRHTRWMGIFLFTVIGLGGVVGAPLYVYFCGITAAEIVLFLTLLFLTNLSISVGYHRLFSHVTYKASPVIQFLLLFFGAATFEQSALKWASQHRQHHRYTDTEKDPHNSKRGFWYSHIGWILFYKHRVNQDNVKDLLRNRLVMHQHNYYNVWSFAGGIVLPMLIGIYLDKILGVFLVSICLRMFLVLNAAFFINSYAHMFGSNRYDAESSARDHWIAALITNGEGYHSFHHRFPSDYRNGVEWHHWDPSKWCIYVLERLGWATHLKRTPKDMIRSFQ